MSRHLLSFERGCGRFRPAHVHHVLGDLGSRGLPWPPTSTACAPEARMRSTSDRLSTLALLGRSQRKHPANICLLFFQYVLPIHCNAITSQIGNNEILLNIPNFTH